MASPTAGVDDYESACGDLELLTSGNFSDVEVICGNRSWKCHIAILVPRCHWFCKALTGPFLEAKTRKVTLAEEDPIYVDLVLKYIYGRGLDIMNSVSKEHYVEHCVSLWHTADFLMLKALKKSVESAVGGYCDKRMKELCMTPHRPTWRHPQHLKQLSPWALDLVKGLRQAYEWRISDLKAVLMEFIWVARSLTLQNGMASVLFDHLKDTPSFPDDFLGTFVSVSWMSDSVWVPPLENVTSHRSSSYCLRCSKQLSFGDDSGIGKGQIVNVFMRDSDNAYKGGWCSACGEDDNIPWRMERQKKAPSTRPGAQPQTPRQRP